MGYWGFAVISLMRELAHTRAHTCVQAHVHMHALANSYKARTPASCMHIAHVHTYLHTPTGTRNLCVHIHTQAHTHKPHNAVCTCNKRMHAHTCTHTYTEVSMHTDMTARARLCFQVLDDVGG